MFNTHQPRSSQLHKGQVIIASLTLYTGSLPSAVSISLISVVARLVSSAIVLPLPRWTRRCCC